MNIYLFLLRPFHYQTGCKLLKTLGFTLIMMIIKLDIKLNQIIKLSQFNNQVDNGDYQGQVPVIIRKYGQFNSLPLVCKSRDYSHGQHNRTFRLKEERMNRVWISMMGISGMGFSRLTW